MITVPGVQEDFLRQVTWLPDHDQIVLTIRETAHGLKMLYGSGHLLEVAVFDEAELAKITIGDYRVLLDRGTITPILAGQVRPMPSSATDDYNPARDLAMVLALIYVGAGRLARGEGLSAHVFIKFYLLYHLLPLLAYLLDSDQKWQLDPLDPFRRFEVVFPSMGERLNRVLSLPPLDTAHALLDLIDEIVRPQFTVFPDEAEQTVRAYLEKVERAGMRV